jgi:hypothetical protein
LQKKVAELSCRIKVRHLWTIDERNLNANLQSKAQLRGHIIASLDCARFFFGAPWVRRLSRQRTVNIFQQAMPDCDEYLQELRENGFTYDWLTVSQRALGINQIKVFYYYRAPLLDNVVLFHNGGPASDSHGSYGIFRRQAETIQSWVKT